MGAPRQAGLFMSIIRMRSLSGTGGVPERMHEPYDQEQERLDSERPFPCRAEGVGLGKAHRRDQGVRAADGGVGFLVFLKDSSLRELLEGLGFAEPSSPKARNGAADAVLFFYVFNLSKSIDGAFLAGCMSRFVPPHVAVFGFWSLSMSRIVRLHVAKAGFGPLACRGGDG